MSWWDDFVDIAANVATGGLYGAVSAATDTTTTQGSGPPVDTTAITDGLAKFIQAQQREKAAQAAAANPPCCGRYQLHDGFLVDGVTGHVWRFNPDSNALEEVPLTHAPAKRALIGILVTAKAQQIADRYAAEVLPTLPDAEREKQRLVFDKIYLEPLRAAAQGLA